MCVCNYIYTHLHVFMVASILLSLCAYIVTKWYIMINILNYIYILCIRYHTQTRRESSIWCPKYRMSSVGPLVKAKTLQFYLSLALGAEDQVPGLSSSDFPGTLERSWTWSEVTVTLLSTYIGCQHCTWWLNLLQHNADANVYFCNVIYLFVFVCMANRRWE